MSALTLRAATPTGVRPRAAASHREQIWVP